ncbi:MAG: hypothetical protein KGY41_03190 [Desulfovermiculus sp.]|nr:hypothetical protein [Desulfovermiculus sp.]
MLAEQPLHEVRQARGMTQKVLADVLQVNQPIEKMPCQSGAFLLAMGKKRKTALT